MISPTATRTTRIRGMAAKFTLGAIEQSENGALTDVAIREHPDARMGAVASLVRAGLVVREVGDAWIENDRGGMDLVAGVTTLRLTYCPHCGAAKRRPTDGCGC